MQTIDIQRRYGPRGITRVHVTRGGKDYVFYAGRHIGTRRIYELAGSLKLKKVGE